MSNDSPKGRGFDALLQAALPAVHQWVRKRRGVAKLGAESSTDLVQSICREALLAREGYSHESDEKFEGWLKTVADRKLTDRVRHWSATKREAARTTSIHRSSVPSDGEPSMEGMAIASQSEPAPDLAAEAVELEERVTAAIMGLSDAQRAVLELGRLDGLSTAAIAERLDKTEVAVRLLRSRALAKIAEAL